MMPDLIVLSLLLGLLCLDRKQALQINISQPLFSALLAGWWLGNFEAAIYFALLLQLLWPGHLPVGASRVPNGALASAAGIVLYVFYYEDFAAFGGLLLLLCTLYVVALSHAMTDVNHLVYKSNRFFINRILEKPAGAASAAKKISVSGSFWASMVYQFLVNSLMLFASILLGQLIIEFILPRANLSYNHLWMFVEPAIWGSGVGLVLSLWKANKFRGAFLTVLILTLVIGRGVL